MFCNETGYQNAQIGYAGGGFQRGKNSCWFTKKNGTWSLPGGWCDVLQSVRTNTVKEVKEETGLDVKAVRLIALQDRNKHNVPVYAYGVCKVFVLCELIGGEFTENVETTEIAFFDVENLPANLAKEKNHRTTDKDVLRGVRRGKLAAVF